MHNIGVKNEAHALSGPGPFKSGRIFAALFIVLLGIVPAEAAELLLPALPEGCHYTSNNVTPLSGLLEVPAGTRRGEALGSRSEVVRVGVQCEASESAAPQDVSLVIQGSPENWREGSEGGDVALTSVRDMGVRWFFDAQSSGGEVNCTSPGTLGQRYTQASCRMAVNGKAKSLTMTLSAQWVKLGNSLPLRHSGMTQLTGGDLQFTVNGIATPLSGLLGTSLVSQVSCSLETPRTQTVDFGRVERPRTITGKEYQVGGVHVTPVGVRCLPVRNEGDSNYKVNVKFTPGGKGIFAGDDSALSTSIDDVIIRFSSSQIPGTDSWLHFNSLIPLEPDPAGSSDETGSYFAKNFYWYLFFLPVEQRTGTQSGSLSAMATYTVTVEE